MSPDIVRALLIVLVNGTLFLGISLLTTRLFGWGSASLRHLILFSALLSLILLVPASSLLPTWNLPPLPAISLLPETAPQESVEADDSAPASAAAGPTEDEPAATATDSGDGRPEEGAGFWGAILGFITNHLPWIALFLWASGAMVIMIIQLVRWAGAGFIASMASSIESTSQLKAAERIRADLRLAKPVALLRSEMTAVTMAWGIRRPCIVLPADSENWSRERVEAVLQHEFAHIRRNDNLLHLFAVVASAVFWFNPLVWIVMRRLNYEREVACDDQVLNSGIFASSYARHLMDLNLRLAGPKSEKIIPAVMAHSSNIKKRLLSILNPKVNRQPLKPAFAALYLLVIMVFALPVAAFQPWANAPEGDRTLTFSGRIHTIGRLQNLFFLDGRDCTINLDRPLDFKLISPEAFLILCKYDEEPAIRFEVRVGRGGQYRTTYFLDDVEQPFDKDAEALFRSLLIRFGHGEESRAGEDNDAYTEWYRKLRSDEQNYSEAYNEWLKKIEKEQVYTDAYLKWRAIQGKDDLLRLTEYEQWLESMDKDQVLTAAFIEWMESMSMEKHMRPVPPDREILSDDSLVQADEEQITPGDVDDALLGKGDLSIDFKHVELNGEADWLYRITEPNGYLIITRIVDGVIHRYEIRSNRSGKITKTYIVDDKRYPFDEEIELRFRRLLRSICDFSDDDEPLLRDDP